MGALTATKTVPVEEYLSDPAYEHCEYVDGQIVELNAGGIQHGRIAIKCGRKLDEYFDARKMGYVAGELHCRLEVGDGVCYRLPDVAVVLGPEDRGEYLNRAPDLVIEIRSPKDTMTHMLRKMDEYFANGSKIGWIVLPEESSVLVLTPDARPRTFTAGQRLDGGDVLPGLAILVDDLFA